MTKDSIDADGRDHGKAPTGGAEMWLQRWQNQDTPWNLGRAHPRLDELLRMASGHASLPTQGRCLIPCCGHAHDAAALVHLGFTATGVDIVPEAIAAATSLYGDLPGLSLLKTDFFSFRDPQGFHFIFDRASLCAMPPDLWAPYVAACAANLPAGGLWMGAFFSERKTKPEAGPPFAISHQDMLRLTAETFDFVAGYEYELDNPDSVIQSETLMIFSRK